jgi:hypothetical protein
MALHAIDDLGDTLEVTRSFLTPVDLRTWLRLALITVFAGLPGANLPGVQTSVDGGGGGGAGTDIPSGAIPDAVRGADIVLLVGILVAAAVVLGLAFLLVSSVMEFVLVESLRAETVTVRRYWSRRWRQGLRLFGFRVLFGAVVLGSVLAVVGPTVLSALDLGPASLAVSGALLLLLVPFVILLVIVAGLVNGFTTVFVVPVMVLEDCGVLAGWRRLWPTVVDQWKQYLAYAVIGFVLSATGSVVVGILVGAGVLVLLLPFGLLFALGFGLFLIAEPVGIAVVVVVGLLFLLAVLTVVAVAGVPVVTYLRYYALLVLGDIEPTFDLVSDQRAAVRDEDDDGAVAG